MPESDKKYSSTPALSGLNLSLERGQIVGLLGPNGSGKSTLIKLAAGVLHPSQGEILLNGLAPGVETKDLSLICRTGTAWAVRCAWMKS